MAQAKSKIWGKVILGLLFSMKGWVWAIIGAMIGHILFDKNHRNEGSEAAFDTYRRRQGRFIFHVFTLCAKVAKAKGSVGRAEIVLMEKLMRNQFQMKKEAREDAVQIWKNSKDSDIPFPAFAQSFYSEFRMERHQVYSMMDLLFAIAAADGHMHPQQEQLLLQAAGIFQISRLQYNRIKQRYFYIKPEPAWKPLDPHYAILGATPADSMDVIKKKYRKLAQQYHPDKVMATGASEAQVKHAQKKFQEVQEAYEKLSSMRQI